MKRVAIESPFAADTPAALALNRSYLLDAIRDCLARGESPYASHLMLTQALDDNVPEQRELGITAGLAWAERAEARVVYIDRGISPGMERGIQHAHDTGQLVEYRKLKGWSKP